ncbi:MAG: pilus assembly PilX N-terminal domain-containing protein [Candidatus Omnitrophica bacterium]|nr:pilus assembly PilX N-terminal domain-containing protein [Candidatus Omnitrophota bacterium]
MDNEQIRTMFRKLKNRRGSLLLISYLAIVVLIGLSAAFMLYATNEARISERQRLETVAFYIAESGLQRMVYDLKLDYASTGSWNDGDIGPFNIGPDTSSPYVVPYVDTSLNGGQYLVSLRNVASSSEIKIISTGTIQGATSTIVAYVSAKNTSPWDYVIFAGAGQAGAMINGTVDIAGSVLILGTGLDPTDLAVNLGGTADFVQNNYSGLDAALQAKISPLPTTIFNGETVSTLNAELRVKNGVVALSGSAGIGSPDVAGNSVKETVDAVYVTDGWGGNKGANNVFSDNGTTRAYDLGDSVVFPSLSDPDPDNPSLTVQQKFRSEALILTNELSNLKPNSSFSYTDGINSISMDGSGNLSITGKIYIDGDNNLNFNKNNTGTTITYSGKGTVFVTGSAEVNTNLITSGNNSFPANSFGIMTPHTIGFYEAQTAVMGAFYAEDTITITKQTDVIGTIVSNYFDMGTNVPSIYQAPDLSRNLPPGMIGGSSSVILDIFFWYET